MDKGFSGAFENPIQRQKIPVQILFLNFLFCVEFIRDVDIAVVNFWIFAVVIVLRFYFVVQHNNPLSNFDLNGWLRALG